MRAGRITSLLFCYRHTDLLRLMIVTGCLRRMGLIAIASCPVIAGAQGQVVVFTTLTTPNNTGADVAGGSVTAVPPSTWAATFSANGNFNLLDAKVSVFPAAGDPTFNVFIAGDFTGTPNNFIHWRQIGFGLSVPSGGGVVTANSIATPIPLTSGTQYWIVVAAANPHSRLVWNLGSPSPTFTEYNHSDPNISFLDNNWFGLGGFPLQFQIDGTPAGPTSPPATPLPPSLILSLTGLAIAGLYQMRGS